MSTYRERRLAKAERLRDWAGAREQAAVPVQQERERYRGDHAFNFQPGHIPERARLIKREDAMFRSLDKADEMRGRADGIERQAAGAIYSDDPDAKERLEEKIAQLTAKREEMKAANAAYRKAHREELKGLSAYGRSQAVPFPSYAITNLTGNIARCKERLAGLGRQRVDRVIEARYAGACADCGAAIEKGQRIRYSRASGARCVECREGGE